MRKFFTENIGLKVASILLAVILWFFATSRGQSEISINVPLMFKDIPSGLEMVNSDVKEISLNIKGQERLIKNIGPSNIRVYVDLSKAKKGESTYYINRDDIKLPHAITVTNISPSSIKIVLEETITKTVKVRYIVIGDPERGYYIKSIEVVPQTVVIEGIKSEVRKITNIKTEPFDITGLNETLTQDLKPDLTNMNIRATPNVVKVKVLIGARTK